MNGDAGNSPDFAGRNQITVFTFKFITQNEILVGSVDGISLCRLNDKGRLEIIRHLDEIPESKVSDIIKKKNGDGFIIATENNGIFQLIPKDEHFKVLKIGSEITPDLSGVQHILEDRISNLWISTFGSGLVKLEYSANGKYNKAIFFNKSTGFSTNYVKTAYEDREGIIWSGNYGTGLTQITGKVISFYTYDESRYGTSVNSVFVQNDYCWLGTNKGLLKTDQATGKILKFYSRDSGLPPDKITAIYANDKNELWIGTGNHGVFRMITDNEKIYPYEIGKGILENSITSITGGMDQIWIGTKKGVCRIELSSDSIQWYNMIKGELPHNYVHHLFMDSTGKLWITTNSNILTSVKGDKIRKIMISSEKGILSLGPVFVESDSTIWVGSNGSGIFRIKSDSITNLTSKQGLLSDFCYSLIVDNQNNLWVGHRGGLSKVRTSDLFVKPMQQYAGIKSYCEFNANAVFKDSKNRILFGTNEGLFVYDPNSENKVFLPPVLNIKSVTVNDEEVDFNKKIVLTPGHYKLKIDFLGINLREPKLVRYKYQLLGYDHTPENTESTGVLYPHLSEGKYTFVLSALTGDGFVTKSPVTVSIVINTPVWKQWWFYVLIFLMLVISVIIIIKQREYNFLREKRILEDKVNERTTEITEKNILLEEKQKRITNQNIELEKYRNYLEDLVDERTKELMEAKNKAEESDRLKTAFLNNLSHEIRTPLNAISGFSEVLSKSDKSKNEKKTYIDIIHKNIDSLLFLFDEIMDLSLMNAGQFKLVKERFTVDDVLNDLEDHFKFNRDKQIEFEFINKLQNSKLILHNDKERFRQIFINLLNNAFKFTESGSVKFGYGVFEKQVHFFVSDTGIGIDKSETDKIFNPFYKIEKDINKLYRGAGIGLTVCKNLVELMGGEIWVDSEFNKGSTFYFTLPVSKDAPMTAVRKKKTAFKNNFLKNTTILVAEDDPDNYELVYRILNPYGAKIVWASNGQEAIDFIKKNPSIEDCIVLMDIQMPVVDGYEANKQIKSINSKIPVIALTAYALASDREKIKDEKFDEYISKPIKVEILLNLLLKFVESK